jgi:hypothetical protein
MHDSAGRSHQYVARFTTVFFFFASPRVAHPCHFTDHMGTCPTAAPTPNPTPKVSSSIVFCYDRVVHTTTC